VVHTENLNLTTAIFDNGARQTYFSGSYNELRDKPTIPAAGDPTPSWVKETQNLVALSGFNKDLGWIDIINRPAWISSAQSVINLSGFNKDLTWADVQSKPSWITTTQSSINLSGFNKNLAWADIQSPPGWMPNLFYSEGFILGGTQPRHLQFEMNIFPKTDLSYVCGSAGLRWASIYANSFYGANYLQSDASLKKDIVPAARRGLADIEALQVVDFTWKADGKSDTGLIAQQAREVNPAFYHESAGIGNIAQYPLIIALLKSVQELSEKIKVLEGAHARG
jgi:hypothetical protein